MRADADEATLVVVGRRCGRDHRAGGEERRHRVRERDLGDDAVGVEVGDAALVVPVAGAAVVLEVAERVRVLPAPGVELLLPFLGEVLAVRRVVGAGVAIRRDDRVAVGGGGRERRHGNHAIITVMTQSTRETTVDALLRTGLRRMQRLHASRRIFASMAGAAGADLTQQGVDILTVLADGAARPIGEVARLARMDAGAVSRQLNRLVEDGYVRRDGATRGSVVLVTATKRGRAAARQGRGRAQRPVAARAVGVDGRRAGRAGSTRSCAWPTTCRARRTSPCTDRRLAAPLTHRRRASGEDRPARRRVRARCVAAAPWRRRCRRGRTPRRRRCRCAPPPTR